MADPKAPPAISGATPGASSIANSFGIDMSGYKPPESTAKKMVSD